MKNGKFISLSYIEIDLGEGFWKSFISIKSYINRCNARMTDQKINKTNQQINIFKDKKNQKLHVQVKSDIVSFKFISTYQNVDQYLEHQIIIQINRSKLG